jgi:hypothetical protein
MCPDEEGLKRVHTIQHELSAARWRICSDEEGCQREEIQAFRKSCLKMARSTSSRSWRESDFKERGDLSVRRTTRLHLCVMRVNELSSFIPLVDERQAEESSPRSCVCMSVNESADLLA